MHRISSFFREPLILFSLTAAALFGLHALAGDPVGKTIEIRPEAIAAMINDRQALLGRQLTLAERDEIGQSLVRQEILVQEAAARDLHLHDSKTRERLVAQMYFVMTEDAPDPRPEDLTALFDADPERYMFSETVSFDHVFFKTDHAAAKTLMDQVRAGADVPQDVGDRFWLGNRMEYYAPAQLATVMGWSFSGQLKDLERGKWAGPIRSGRGWHIVRLDTFHPPSILPPEELDRRLRADWTKAYRERSFEERLQEMRVAYTIDLPSQAEIQAAQPRLQTAQMAPTK